MRASGWCVVRARVVPHRGERVRCVGVRTCSGRDPSTVSCMRCVLWLCHKRVDSERVDKSTIKMVRYSKTVDNDSKCAKARGTHLRIHFKHTREIGEAIKGRTVAKAKAYLENVLQYKDAIPVTKYTGSIGRHSVGKKYKACGDKVAFPQKATKTFIDLLVNIKSNAESRGLDLDNTYITHVNCNQAPKMRRRTYRAHGRVNAYMSSPAHVEIIAEEKNESIVKEKEEKTLKLSKKQLARSKKVAVGGGN